MSRRMIALLLLFCLGGCSLGSAGDSGPAVAVTNVTLLDGRGGPALSDVTILIRGERIAALLPRGARLPRGTHRIDGHGGFLLPGFIDMHAHLMVPRCAPPGGSTDIFDRPLSRRVLGLLLDFGITTIRSPGNPTADGLALRDSLNAGALRGPRARASAEIIMDPEWDEARLRAYVRDSLVHRPDYFKTYAALPPRSVAFVVDEARRNRIPVIGHMGRTSWSEAVQLGVAHLTHAADWSPLSLRPERRASYAAAVRAKGAIRARVDWLELLDPSSPEVTLMLDRVAAAGISVDPTLVAYDSKFSDPAGGRYRRNPYVDLVPELHEDWRSCTAITRDWTAGDYRRWAAAWPNMQALVREMHRRKILLTTGSDLTNPWVIPGESLHQEFELLAEAGMKPLDILRMTGENAGRALGLADVGIIEAGRRADLILLAADPRANISNTRTIRWVMQGGKLVSRGPPRRS